MRKTTAGAVVALLLGCAPGNAGETKSIYLLTSSDFATRRDELVAAATPACAGSCGAVQKGDVLLITASGSLTTSLGVVGPEGSSAWGGNPYTFVNRRAYGLFGRINQNVFFVGRETVVIAPDTGTLELLVNTCTPSAQFTCGAAATGSFATTIFSKLAAGVTVASSPPLTDNSVVATRTVTVDAAATWQPIGVQLDKGQKVFVSSTGTFSAGSRGPVDANGDSTGGNGGVSFVLTNRFAYRLYGRVDGNVVELGADAAFLSPARGELELVVNHMSDTSGALQVAVSSGVVPARGLLLADTAALTQLANVTVPATGAWATTQVHVAKGDPIVASATGQLAGSSVPGGSIGPFGEGGIGGNPYVLTNRPRFALFGRVAGQPFFLGGQNTLLSPATGTLELVVNNSPSCSTCQSCAPGPTCLPCSMCDVQGSFVATIRAP